MHLTVVVGRRRWVDDDMASTSCGADVDGFGRECGADIDQYHIDGAKPSQPVLAGKAGKEHFR